MVGCVTGSLEDTTLCWLTTDLPCSEVDLVGGGLYLKVYLRVFVENILVFILENTLGYRLKWRYKLRKPYIYIFIQNSL